MLFRNDKNDDKEPGSNETQVPLLPLRDIIVFPHMVVPLFVGRQKSIRALEEATQKQGPDGSKEIGLWGRAGEEKWPAGQ